MAKFGPPEAFDFARPAEWPMWRHGFDHFRVVSKLDKDSNEVQVNTLLYAMGREAEAIYDSFEFGNANEHPSYTEVMDKFNDHFVPKRNVIHDRACFHKHV